jgi:crotonobetainyl-CoA:carnitine CoA-transferase CaiB-like acyl-CoA transferase
MELTALLALGKVMPPQHRGKPQNPLMNQYRASDGKWLLLIGAEADRHWVPIATALGATELIDDERFRTSRERRRNAEALVAIFDAIFARRTRDEWAALFAQHDVWWSPVNSFEDLAQDAQAQACGAFVQMPSPTGDGGTQTSVATPVDFGAEPPTPLRAPPQVGSDTQALLREIGIDDAEIAHLRATNVIA